MTYRTELEVANLLERLQEDTSFDVTHPWTVSYRVPIVPNFHVRWAFVAVLLSPENMEDNFWGLQEPEEEDVKLLGLYIHYLLRRWYIARYVKSLEDLPVDIDPGVNTLTFAKAERGWVYRRASWEAPLFSPTIVSETQYATLLELLDSIETTWVSGEEKPNPKWLLFKEENNIT